MIREIKRLIGILAVVALFAIIILIFTVFWPLLATTTTDHAYDHATADLVNITVLCGTVHDCNVFVNNSTGKQINVTIETTAPINAEYKGAQKVHDAFKQNVTFKNNGTSLDLTITLTEGDEMFQLTPSKASVYINMPDGTDYTYIKEWPYNG